MSYRVTVERNTLRFSAAHFTTFGGECEPLHGHNYDVFVDLSGQLTEDSWVVDFVQLKRMVAALCKHLDHRFLLPSQSPHLRIVQLPDAYEIVFAQRRYVIPASDVISLPIDNSTAERLAEWFAQALARELSTVSTANLTEITVGVEESPGQTGWFTLSLRA